MADTTRTDTYDDTDCTRCGNLLVNHDEDNIETTCRKPRADVPVVYCDACGFEIGEDGTCGEHCTFTPVRYWCNVHGWSQDEDVLCGCDADFIFDRVQD